MERMESLRERIAAAMNPLLYEIAMGKRDDTPGGALSYEAADLALAALGLDDLDAAVERCARGIVQQEIETYGWGDEEHEDGLPGLIAERTALWRPEARRGLEAALTATEGADDGAR